MELHAKETSRYNNYFLVVRMNLKKNERLMNGRLILARLLVKLVLFTHGIKFQLQH